LTQEQLDIINYSVASYGFLLNTKEEYRTLGDLSTEIKKIYSLKNPRNKAIIDLLDWYSELNIRQIQKFTWKFELNLN
jgi:hypothetical protein